MIIKPKVKGFICTTSHPQGCSFNVKEQINRVKNAGEINHKIKNALIIGGSTGYGLASRIVLAFGLRANTLNVCLEREAKNGKTASPGWYNTASFEEETHREGLYAKTILGDCFSDETKNQTIDTIKKDLKKIDTVIYSIASAKRTDPITQETYQSALKPIGSILNSKSLNTSTGQLTEVNISPATDVEINHTTKVMGGEDWKRWIDFLSQNDVLANNFTTYSYSYIGPSITQKIYRSGTIGKAKEDLEKTAIQISENNQLNGKAYIVVNKALVTHASSAIPILPLYVSILYKVMKEKNCHEDCLDQIHRLFRKKLHFDHSDTIQPETDAEGMIRLDDWEMQDSIQNQVQKRWDTLNENNLNDLIDLEGYRNDFFKLFGFGLKSIDYDQDVDEIVPIKSLSQQG